MQQFAAAEVATPAQDVSAARRTGPSSTWLARMAKLSEDSVSDVELASGDTQHMSSTFADPHSEACNTCAQHMGFASLKLGRHRDLARTRLIGSIDIHLRELRVSVRNMGSLVLESTDDVAQGAE